MLSHSWPKTGVLQKQKHEGLTLNFPNLFHITMAAHGDESGEKMVVVVMLKMVTLVVVVVVMVMVVTIVLMMMRMIMMIRMVVAVVVLVVVVVVMIVMMIMKVVVVVVVVVLIVVVLVKGVVVVVVGRMLCHRCFHLRNLSHPLKVARCAPSRALQHRIGQIASTHGHKLGVHPHGLWIKVNLRLFVSKCLYYKLLCNCPFAVTQI